MALRILKSALHNICRDPWSAALCGAVLIQGSFVAALCWMVAAQTAEWIAR